jgi:hypothetical protein
MTLRLINHFSPSELLLYTAMFGEHSLPAYFRRRAERLAEARMLMDMETHGNWRAKDETPLNEWISLTDTAQARISRRGSRYYAVVRQREQDVTWMAPRGVLGDWPTAAEALEAARDWLATHGKEKG